LTNLAFTNSGSVSVVASQAGDTNWNAAPTLTNTFTVTHPAGNIGTEWGETTGLPTNLYMLAAGVLSGEVYAVGGFHALTNVYHYCRTNWEEVAGLPASRYNMAVGVCSGLLYAVGGGNTDSMVQTNVYAFNGASWTEVEGLPAGRSTLGVGALGGQVYAIGGYASGRKTNVYRFNGSSWTEVVSLPSARSRMGCGVLNDRLYIVGGFTNTGALTSDGATNVFMFDGETWTEVQGLPEKRGELTACVWNDRLYAIGGKEAYEANPTNSVFRFDGNSWESVAGLPVARSMLASAAVGNQILTIGGTDGSSGQTNVYYFPSGGVSPSSGPRLGGFQVTIDGWNLGDGLDITNVTLCGVAASNIIQSATQVVVTAGAMTNSGLGDVCVFSTSYGETVKSNAFTYNPAGWIGAGGEAPGLTCLYEFSHDLKDTLNNGLDMVPVDTDTETYTPDGWRWTSTNVRGGGLQFDGPAGMAAIFTNYSVGIRFKYDLAGPYYKKVVDYKDRTSDNGFYLHYWNLNFFPYGNTGSTIVTNDQFVDFILTYSGSTSTIDVYMVSETNVSREFGVVDAQSAAVPTNASGRPRFMLFMDDTNTSSEATPGGTVRRIKLWDRPLTQEQISNAMSSASGVTPENGSWTGGYQVVIIGSNLCNGSDITNVTLCGFNATSIGYKSATQVVITAGAGAPRLGDVRVFSTSYGETVKSNAFTYLGPGMAVLGTNGAAITSGDAAWRSFRKRGMPPNSSMLSILV